MKQQYLIASVLLIGMLALSGCTSSEPLGEEHADFAGKWIASDGTSLWIRANGSVDYDGGSTSVSGGQLTIEGSTLTAGLFGIEQSFNIDKAPYESNGKTVMVLDGITFTKQ